MTHTEGNAKEVMSKHNRARVQGPSESLIYLNSPAHTIGSWLAIGILSRFCALSYGRMCSKITRSLVFITRRTAHLVLKSRFEQEGTRAGS